MNSKMYIVSAIHEGTDITEMRFILASDTFFDSAPDIEMLVLTDGYWTAVAWLDLLYLGVVFTNVPCAYAQL